VTQVVYLEKEVTLRGGYSADFGVWDPEQYPTTLDAQQQGRVVYITGAISPVIEGVRLVHGRALDAFFSDGGGLYAITASVTLLNNEVYSNAGIFGGGISLTRGNAYFNNNRVYDNYGGIGSGIRIEESDASLVENSIMSNTAEYEGGGLRVSASHVYLSHNVISANSAVGNGGGVYMAKSVATFLDNGIISNTVLGIPANSDSGNGGGVYASEASITLTENVLYANYAGLSGGGIMAKEDSSITLSENDFISNVAEWMGGGVVLDDALAVLQGNALVSNTATAAGALLLIDSDLLSERNLIAFNSAEGDSGGGVAFILGSKGSFDGDKVIFNQTTRDGGGFLLSGLSVVTCTNVLIADNVALGRGEGIYVGSVNNKESLTLVHTTFANNGDKDGEGIFAEGSAVTVVLTNSIIAGHGVGISATAGSRVQLESTLWGSGAWANGLDWGGAGEIITGTPESNIWGDPGFMDPAAGNYHLRRDSIAIDRGIDAGVLHDMDGQTRPLEGGYDLGADEFPPYWHYFPMVRRE
jgi:hypothetical protein